MEPRQLNDSVYEFSKPSEDFDLEVIAFHGLRFFDYEDAYKTTWQDKDRKRCWLRDVIPKTFPKARILSVSYDSCAEVTHVAGRMSFSNIGRILVQDLIHLAQAGQRGCPVLLIGYCLGGLVIQQLCTEAEKQYGMALDGSSKGRLDQFLMNVRVFLSLDTPYSGSSLGEYLRKSLRCSGPVLEYLSESSTVLGNLNSEFDSLAIEREWDRFCCWYTGSTQFWDSKELPTSAGKVVPEESARRLHGKGECSIIEAPHSGQAVSQPRAWSKLGELLELNLKPVLKEIRDRTKLKGSAHHQETEETAKSTNPPNERHQREWINDSLYEMYRPDPGKNVKLELIFFPGSLDEDAYKTTWMTEDSQCCWLQTWLPEAFPDARIWAVSYGSHQEGQNFNLYTTCENLVRNIVCDRNRDSQQERFREEIPLILVGHCFGGLVIKALCERVEQLLQVDEDNSFMLQEFLKSVRGVAYYGTSHSGYSSGYSSPTQRSTDIIVNRGSSSKDLAGTAMGRLRSGYMHCVTEYGWKELGLGETRPTQGSTDITVDEFAASDGLQRMSFFPMAADHVSICKPKSRTSNSFLYLQYFIRTTLNEAQYRNLNVRRQKRRGIAVIINMEKEDKDGSDIEEDGSDIDRHHLEAMANFQRPGSDIDRHHLEDMANYLEFQPFNLVDRTAEKIGDIINDILEKEVTVEDECILCFVGAHGGVSSGRQVIYDNDGHSIDLFSVILRPIAGFHRLAGKPKVFLFNACRDISRQQVAATGSQQEQTYSQQGMDDLQGFDQEDDRHDCLLMFSSKSGTKSFGNPTGFRKGTLFVNEVTENISLLHKTTDVQDILKKVKEKVPRTAATQGEEQFPVMHSFLRKRLSWRPR